MSHIATNIALLSCTLVLCFMSPSLKKGSYRKGASLEGKMETQKERIEQPERETGSERQRDNQRTHTSQQQQVTACRLASTSSFKQHDGNMTHSHSHTVIGRVEYIPFTCSGQTNTPFSLRVTASILFQKIRLYISLCCLSRHNETTYQKKLSHIQSSQSGFVEVS